MAAGGTLLFSRLPGAFAAQTVTIGFIYAGSANDYGYNQAHAAGRKALDGLAGLKVVEEANVPESSAVEETMRNMVFQDGAAAVFPTSYGFYDPHILKVAVECPDAQFFHCGGNYIEGKHPKNVGTYFGFIDEVEYLAGIAAGLTVKTGKLGFIAAKPIPQVLRNINSFTLGVLSVKPKATVQTVFTGDWFLPIKEAEAANSLADQGIELISSHISTSKVVVETAERRGLLSTGYQFNLEKLAPKGFVTGAEWNWGSLYTRYAKQILEGKSLMAGTIPRIVRGGLKDDFCKLSPYGPAVSEATKKAVEAAKAKLLAGTLQVYQGEIKDNKGNVVVPAGKSISTSDPVLDSMNWLVGGTIGTV
jgi:simple sugar transport system substrate-binding protein